MIFYKDIKAKLKAASNELENLKKRIAGDLFKSSVKLDNHDHIDDQDKAFISQVFMQVSMKSPLLYKKTLTMKEIPEKINKFSYKAYGLEGFNQILESIGNN